MAKGSGNPAGKRPSSRSAQPYDANNSLVKKMANKVTDLIPQSSWISKWFNTSQGNEDTLESRENTVEETELEDDVQQPPSKRSCIRMDVIHPPGTFSIQSRLKTALNTVDSSKEEYSVHNEMTEDFMEPAIAGPSGMGHLISSTPAMQADIRTVTSHRSDLNSLASSTNNGITNGMDDNSELSESTSGCSSLIPQINRHEGPSNLLYSSFSNRKRHIDDKLTYTDHLQTSRSLLLDINSRDTLSSRRPSFNASVVANALDRASPLSSPFYSGNTTFGGANAAGLYKRGRNLFNNSSKLQLKVPGRTNVEVTSPNSAVDSSGMSQTAKKILEALEHFSSPITDAKKIPLKNTNNTVSSTVNRKRAREEVANPSARIGLRHLTRELTVPTVPDILKLKRRQKLQDTTLAARKIISARSDPPPSPQEYRLRTDDNDSGKYRGKLKGKSKINLEQEETVAAVNLPNIPLPITTLPNFNFMLPPPTSHIAGKTMANKENTFTFASPIKVTDSGKNLQSVNNFTFSNPINAEDKNSNADEQCTACKTVRSNPNDKTLSPSTSRTETVVKSKPVANDCFGSQFKLSEDQWECTACCVRNKQSDAKCVACSTLKPRSSSTTPQTMKFQNSDLTEKFKSAEGLWECSGCLLQNAANVLTCPSCSTSKPTSSNTNLKKTDFATESSAQQSSTAGTKNTTMQETTTETVAKSKPVAKDYFGSQFKLFENQWECKTCCVRNKQSDAKCVACSTPKSGSSSVTPQTIKFQNSGLMEKFKSAEGSWECSGCLLRNTANVLTCPCCSTSKPTFSNTNSKKTDFATESSAQQSSTAGTKDTTMQETTTETVAKSKPVAKDYFGSQFKLSEDQWECTACCIRNKQSDAKCVACSTLKPGSSSTTPQIMKFQNSDLIDKLKPAEGSWECSGCLVRNAANVLTCPCCNTSKPTSSNTNPKKTDFATESSAQQSSTAGTKDTTTMQETTTETVKSKPIANDCFGSQFKLSKDQWECTACSVRNKQSDAKCVACSTPKSGSGAATPQIIKSQSSDLMEKLKPAEGSWECSGCLLRNAANVLTCPCCGASKPTSLKTTPKKTDFTTELSAQKLNTAGANDTTMQETMPSNSEIMNKFKPSKDSWECPGCLVRNNNSVTTCPCCNTAKSGSLGGPNKAEQTPTNSFGDKFKKPEGAWSCDSCLLQNDAKHTQCVACEAPKPGTVRSNVSTSSSSSTLQFKFGVLDNTSNNSGGFKFGIDKADNQSKSDSASPLNGFKFGNTQQNTGTAQFAFDKNKIPTFGSSTENKPLIFGSPKEETKLPGFNSSAQTPAVNPVPTFGAPSNSATPSLFGTPNTPAFGNTTTPAFGDTATTPAIFTFGSTSSQQPSSGFNFSANTNPPAESSAKPFFTFGSNSSTPQSNNNMFGSFGAPTNTAPTNAPNFAFNPSKQEAPTAFGQDAATTPMFGTSQTNPQTQAPPSFSSTPSSSTGFNFGSTAPPAAASGGFNFGGMPSTATPTGGFNFNPPTTAPTVAFDPNSRPSFNFTKGNVPAAFNAPPQSAAGSQRKIKKAFRRCMR